MSKYNALWKYVMALGKKSFILTFEEISDIVGSRIDHSFLQAKKELSAYGYEVGKISMKEQTVMFRKILNNKLVLYIHGKGGSAEEAAHYKPLFPDSDVVGLEYEAETPKEARAEFPRIFERYSAAYDRIVLIANSIGAYFSMCALPQNRIQKAYFISPITDMERLIQKMMTWANVSEDDLRKTGMIATDFGETLSWEYFSYVRAHPVDWAVPTEILYGDKDHLTDLETVTAFASAHGADLTVMKDGEHWFHTSEQMKFLDEWIVKGREK